MRVCAGWLPSPLTFLFVVNVGHYLVLCAAPSVLLMQCIVLIAFVPVIVSSRSIEYRYVVTYLCVPDQD
jgi:hypothetical protein